MTLHYTDIAEQAGNVKQVGALQPRVRRSIIYRSVAKRILDISLVLIASPFIVPIVLFLALAVWMRDGGKPFYFQKRVGQGGEVFTMWKLRSMVVDADNKLEDYIAANPTARAEWDSKQKLVQDPRITQLGAFMRKSSLDELPQLLNVLLGQMSLVGPRPMMPKQKHLYPGLSYYKLRPGVTGLWQISDRHQSEFSRRASFDNEYYRNVSFVTDVKIILQTIKVVARGTGC